MTASGPAGRLTFGNVPWSHGAAHWRFATFVTVVVVPSKRTGSVGPAGRKAGSTSVGSVHCTRFARTVVYGTVPHRVPVLMSTPGGSAPHWIVIGIAPDEC